MPVRTPLALSALEVAERLCARPGFAWLDGDGGLRGERSYVLSDPIERRVGAASDPLQAFRGLELAPIDCAARVPRYVGYVTYEAGVRAFRGAQGTDPSREDEDGELNRYDACIQVDHVTGEATLFADDEAARDAALSRLRPDLAMPASVRRASLGPIESEPPDRHRTRITAALEAIGEGQLYQVNLARAFSCDFSGDPFALALALREASPVPFGFCFTGVRRRLFGRSMERFLAYDAATRSLETRPIKGTVARAEQPTAPTDAEAARALVRDAKERAEHAMVIDLLRNDLGAVARTGSVEVAESFAVEAFARLAHLVATVRCEVRDGLSLHDVLRATLPPGSVTGTPKSRALTLIERLEDGPRGPYCGAYGYVTDAGDGSFAVAIRTATLDHGRLRYHAGGGIVEASDPDRELAETELKTRVLRDASEALAARETTDRVPGPAEPRRPW